MRHTLRVILLAAVVACTPPAFADAGKPAGPGSPTLTVSGGVQHALTVDAASLRKRAPQQIVTLQLPGKDGGAPSVLRGVRLRDLLDEAAIASTDHNTVKKLAIIAGASDGYKVVFSWSELFNSPLGDGVLVVFERDGKPLSQDEGPLALISAHDLKTGPRHVKWLQAVEVRQIVE